MACLSVCLIIFLCASCSGASETQDAKTISSASATNVTSEVISETTASDSVVQTETAKHYSATYSVIVDAFDWGPASVKAIIALPEPCRESDLCEFIVTETTPDGKTRDRTVTDVYLSDSDGIRVADESSYFSIEMAVIPYEDGSVFKYDMVVLRNVYSDNYSLIIEPEAGSEGKLSSLSVDPSYSDMIIPDLEVWQTGSFSGEDISLNYALFEPEESDTPRPLIIWIHGMGEGGDDPTIALLGNRVTAFAEEEIQSAFSGAYVLVPQCPGYWPEATQNDGSYGGDPDGTSAYTEPLMGLIEKIVSENEGIDPGRIYIGGCSMGGYMTLNMVFNYSDYFAAAFPVCAYYPDELIGANQLSILSEIPIWYAYCTSDRTVPPAQNSEATIARLKDMGVNVHVSTYEKVLDTTGLYTDSNGEPFEYYDHWVWLYVFNSECKDGDLTLWEYLKSQSNG